MNKQDVDKAASALTGAIGYFAPMVNALNQADEVFSVLSNAIKLKDFITKEVDKLKAEKDSLVNAVAASKAASKEAIAENDAAAMKARAMAAQAIADAKEQADAKVKEILDSVVTSTKAAVEESKARQAELAAAVVTAQASFNATTSEMQATKAAMESDIAVLDKKLENLRAQAKKFAASLVE